MSTSKIKAVAFDLFGTLLEIRRPQNPYGMLLDALQLSREERAEARQEIMSKVTGLCAVGKVLGHDVPEDVLIDAELALYDELTSVNVFDDTWETWMKLAEQSFGIAIASNLAFPYCVPAVMRLPFEPNACAWSFNVSATKPSSAFYDYLCQSLGCHPCEVLMVGDNRANDYEGAKAAGLHALLLNRSQAPEGDRIQGLGQVFEHLA